MVSAARSFYIIGSELGLNPPGLIFENEELLRLPGVPVFGPIDVSDRGLRPFAETPRFLYRRKLGRTPRDLERVSAYWLVSSRTKATFEAIDPAAFDFAPCAMTGLEAPVDYFLCDVIRILDVVDETSPRLKIYRHKRRVHYGFPMSQDVQIHAEKVGAPSIFRLDKSWADVVCDSAFRAEVKRQKLRGFSFCPIGTGPPIDPRDPAAGDPG